MFNVLINNKMNTQSLNELINTYKMEYDIEVYSKNKHFVVVGGNMTANYHNGSLKLFSSNMPTKLDSNSCDDFIKNHSGELISITKMGYDEWLQRRIKVLKKLLVPERA